MNISKTRFIVPATIAVLTISSIDIFKEPTQSYTAPSSYDVSFKRLENLEIVKIDRSKMLKPKELKNILELAGFDGENLKIAWAVVMKESTGRPYAHNQNRKTGDNSYGLFQINMIDSLGPARRKQFGLSSNEMLFDPLVNAKIAYQISNKGKDWSAWGGISERVLHFMEKFPV
jgi:hypothetical protein